MVRWRRGPGGPQWIAAWLVAGAAWVSAQASAVPARVPYVGYLEYDSGAPYNGFATVELALFATQSPVEGVDVPLWGPVDYGDVFVSSGILSVVVGSAEAPLDSALLDAAALWLAIRVNNVPLQPLQRVLSVPYAMRAADSDRLGGLEAAWYLTEPDLGELGYATTSALGASFASKATETDLSALEQVVAALSAEVLDLQSTVESLAACCEAGGGGGFCSGAPDGTQCDDANACTVNDACVAGICSGTPIDCDDGDPCTVASCDPATGCQYAPSDTPACLGLPDDEEIFAERTHVNVVRLDTQHLVVFWGIETNTSAPHSGFYAQVWRREAGTWTKGTPLWVAQPLLPVGSDNAFALTGALGGQHALVIAASTDGTSWSRNLLLLRRTGLSLAHVGTYPQTAAFFMGHPIDDTRYLLKYRYNNSGQPVHYRVVSRSGDALSFGPEFVRPDPSAFPSGAASSEPQTNDPLVRIGATQFRELRGGYVWATGNKMSSWILTVSGTSISASGLATHNNSAEKTMSALAVGNGSGGVAMLYESYGAGLHAATMSGTAFAALGLVPGSAGTSLQAAGYESTDGFYGNKYWMRARSGELYRFDAHGSVPVEVANGLVWHACYRAPAIVRMGNEAMFLVCPTTASSPQTLRTINLDPLL